MRTQEYEAELAKRLTVYQAQFDAAMEPFNRRAPAPTLGTGANEFRRDSLSYMKKYLPPNNPWRDVSLAGLRSDALNVAQSAIIEGLRDTARDPRLMALTPAARIDPMDNSIRMIERNLAGKKVIEYHGNTSFVVAMGRPGRRVVGWNTSSGPVMASGNTRWR
jgi:hypothetical protein